MIFFVTWTLRHNDYIRPLPMLTDYYFALNCAPV